MFLNELKHLPGFVKISHSVFALPFAIAALLLAHRGIPSSRICMLVVAAVVTARLSAMAFNRLVDARFDALNPRTAQRHIPSGLVSRSTAWGLVLCGIILFVGIAWLLNPLAGKLSPVAILFVLGYSYTKRFTSFSHFVLGIALGMAPLGAWVAVRSGLNDPVPWMLAMAVMFWVAGFDMIYALQDVDFDRTQGLHSMGVKLGKSGILKLVPVLHTAMLLLLAGVGYRMNLGWSYAGGMLFVLGGLLWEEWLIRHLNHRNLQWAFLQANAVVSFGFLAAVLLAIFYPIING